jgi:hypothetical protein
MPDRSIIIIIIIIVIAVNVCFFTYFVLFLLCVLYLYNVSCREIGWNGMACIELAQDRDQWRTLVNTVMNLRVP